MLMSPSLSYTTAPNCSAMNVPQLTPSDGRPKRPVSNNFFPSRYESV
jgi:hypothetical protein